MPQFLPNKRLLLCEADRAAAMLKFRCCNATASIDDDVATG